MQTGVGRTGKFFAYEHSGAAPDIMTIAKGIGGGFPMGACLATADAARGLTVGVHGSTFGGNPLAMAVGNAVLDVVLADGFIDRVARLGGYARQRLAELKDRHPEVIAEVRGEGLLIGLKLKVAPQDFAAAARRRQLLTIPAGDNVVRLLPPLIISEEEFAEGVRRLDDSLRRPRSRPGARQERRLRMIPTAALGARRRHFLDLLDCSADELRAILDAANAMKAKRTKGEKPTVPSARRQDAGAGVRPAVDPHPRLVRSGDARAGRRDDHAHRRRDAARPRRVDPRHGARAVALRRRDHDPHPRATPISTSWRATPACR